MGDFLLAMDAARLLGLSPDAIRAAAKTGRLSVGAVTEGGVRLFRRADVETFARERRSRKAGLLDDFQESEPSPV